jgi:hypothetical protein
MTSSPALLQATIAKLASDFKVKEMGALKSFLGVMICCSHAGFFLSQETYAKDILDLVGMSDTLVDLNGKLPAVADPYEYRNLIGELQYLTCHILFNKHVHMQDLRECHLALIKCILQYVHGTTSLDLHLRTSSSTSLMVYIDADWFGSPDGDPRQATASSSASPWCLGPANANLRCPVLVRRPNTVRRQMLWYGFDNFWANYIVQFTVVVFCDNVIYMTSNPVHH